MFRKRHELKSASDRLIIRHWPKEFRALYGGSLPESYCALDTETTGFNREKDVVTEIGHCLVRDRLPTDRYQVVLDWTREPAYPLHQLRERLDNLAYHMNSKGITQYMTLERMRAEGIPPREALEWYHQFLMVCRESELMFVMHNGFQFDEEMLTIAFASYTEHENFIFGRNELYDTGAVEKASNSTAGGELPMPGEDLRDYFGRISRRPLAGVKWALDPHCVERYGLAQFLGPEDRSHSAGTDAFLTHKLFEAHRDAFERLPLPDPSEPCPYRLPLAKSAKRSGRKAKPVEGAPSPLPPQGKSQKQRRYIRPG